MKVLMNKAQQGIDAECVTVKEDGPSILRYSSDASKALKDGYIFTIIQNNCGGLRYMERGEYEGS